MIKIYENITHSEIQVKMKISQILAKQNETKLIQAKKLAFRELEEVESKGNFMAYVDEGEESYDVNIQLDKDVVVSHSCDCGFRDTYCIHQMAILMQLLPGGRQAPATKRNTKTTSVKKIKESEQLLLTLEQETLSSWLLELFQSNKDLELQFLLKFGKSQKNFQQQDVAKILKDAVVSVIGKRKKLEASEVKKIVQIWEKALEPFWEYLALNIGNEKIIDLFPAVHAAIADFEYRLFYTGTRFRKFVELNNSKIAVIINNIEAEAFWIKLIDVYWDKMWTAEGMFGEMFGLFVLIYHNSNADRKRFLAIKVEKLVTELSTEGLHHSVSIDDFFLDVLLENDLFGDNLNYFVPQHWEAKYNLKLIEAVKDFDIEKAIDYCHFVIQGNVNPAYDTAFYDILEELYSAKDDVDNLSKIKLAKFNLDPNIVDYMFIMGNCTDEELKGKFRTKTLSLLRNNMVYPEYADLYFRILEYEMNYKKMLELIDYRIGPSTLLKFWDYIYAVDKLKFLHAIANNLQIDYRSDQPELERLISKITESYNLEEIKLMFKPDLRSNYQFTFKAMVYKRLF